MTTLLELKEKLIRFYGKNEVFITPVIKFAVALATFLLINGNIGYMESISKTPIALILAVLCSVLPVNGIIVLASLVILADLYALSLEVCLVAVILLLIVYFVYFRFAPKNGYDVLLLPLCLKLHIPCTMSVGMGLLREIYSIFSLICGTVVYFFLNGVHENEAVLSDTAEEDGAASKIVIALNQLLGNKEMYLVLGILIATTLIVFFIRRMSIENAWSVAIISGVLFETIGLIAGYMLLEIPVKWLPVLLGNAVSCGIAFVLQFLFFNLDYSRAERLQFEDDEYYYYVKAIPKKIVSGTDKQVKRFSGKEEQEERRTRKQFAEELDIDEELLD